MKIRGCNLVKNYPNFVLFLKFLALICIFLSIDKLDTVATTFCFQFAGLETVEIQSLIYTELHLQHLVNIFVRFFSISITSFGKPFFFSTFLGAEGYYKVFMSSLIGEFTAILLHH